MTPRALARLLYDALLDALPASARVYIMAEEDELLGMIEGALGYLLTAPPAGLVGPVLALVGELIDALKSRKVEVTAGPGVVPTITIEEG